MTRVLPVRRRSHRMFAEATHSRAALIGSSSIDGALPESSTSAPGKYVHASDLPPHRAIQGACRTSESSSRRSKPSAMNRYKLLLPKPPGKKKQRKSSVDGKTARRQRVQPLKIARPTDLSSPLYCTTKVNDYSRYEVERCVPYFSPVVTAWVGVRSLISLLIQTSRARLSGIGMQMDHLPSFM